jgi:tetratricopeptide (TPR) repeat protein
MRSKSDGLTSRCTAAMVSGLFALTSVTPAFAQGKPAAAAPAKPAAAAPAKPAAAPAKPAAAAPAKKKLTEAQAKDAAKKHYKDGEAKFEKGDYAGALADYTAADELVPGAVPKYKIAQSVDKQNKAVDAVAAYQKFLDSNPEAAKHQERIDDAKKRIEALKATPATVKVTVEPVGAANLKLAVDGAAQTGTELSVAPGHHTITATADGLEGKSELDVTFAETKDLTITLSPVAVAVVAPPVAPAPAAPVAAAPAKAPEEAPAAEPRSNIPAYVTLGLAVVGAGVGTVFGIQALGSKSDYEANPTRDGLDKVERQSLLADMSFAVALTFGVTGTVLLLTNTSSSAKPKASALTRPVIAPYATPQGGGAAALVRF